MMTDVGHVRHRLRRRRSAQTEVGTIVSRLAGLLQSGPNEQISVR